MALEDGILESEGKEHSLGAAALFLQGCCHLRLAPVTPQGMLRQNDEDPVVEPNGILPLGSGRRRLA
jgi:hypothetical protein